MAAWSFLLWENCPKGFKFTIEEMRSYAMISSNSVLVRCQLSSQNCLELISKTTRHSKLAWTHQNCTKNVADACQCKGSLTPNNMRRPQPLTSVSGASFIPDMCKFMGIPLRVLSATATVTSGPLLRRDRSLVGVSVQLSRGGAVG